MWVLTNDCSPHQCSALWTPGTRGSSSSLQVPKALVHHHKYQLCLLHSILASSWENDYELPPTRSDISYIKLLKISLASTNVVIICWSPLTSFYLSSCWCKCRRSGVMVWIFEYHTQTWKLSLQFIETCYSDRLELEVGGLEVLLGVASMHGKVLLGVASMHRKVLVGKGPIRGGFHSRKGPIRGGFHAWKGPIRGGLYISPVSEAGGDEDQALLARTAR